MSSPADGGNIADELAANQRQISISEFFEKNRQMLGFDSGSKALVTAVKEAVDNALDATEEARILPDIYVEIKENGEYYTLIIEDNGPGITAEQIPKIFGKLLYGSRFGSRSQSRGQQGIGISAAVLYSQLTSGKPARITSRPKGSDKAQYYELIIDTDNNEPEIQANKEISWDRPHGTRIELDMDGNMRGRSQLHDYIKYTAVVNPHARVQFIEPRTELKYDRSISELPAETTEIKPHPHGVELGTVMKMLRSTKSQTLSGFLKEEFTRVGSTTAENILDNFRDTHHGRELALNPPETGRSQYEQSPLENPTTSHPEGTLCNAIQQAISRKPADASEGLANDLADTIVDAAPIAHTTLVTLVDERADVCEEEFDVRFGKTVRENIIDDAWDFVQYGVDKTLYSLLDEATSTNKTEETVRNLTERTAEKLTTTGGDTHRFTRRELAGHIDAAADLTQNVDKVSIGETARENITNAIWNTMQTIRVKPPLVRELRDDRDMCSDLLSAMKLTDIIAPPTDCLSPIGPENIEVGLKKVFDADFYAGSTRDASVHGGDPFIAEAGIAYGGSLEDEGKAELLRFANRVPLVYQRGGCAITSVVREINWRNYGPSQPGGAGIPTGSLVLLVHVASTNVPFTSESKDAVAAIPEIESEVELAIREVSRELKTHLNEQKSLRKHQRKQNTITEILPEMSEKIGIMTGTEPPNYTKSLARIMNNVAIERDTSANDSVVLSVTNYQNNNSATLSITEIVEGESVTLPDESPATVETMDGETFITWDVTLDTGGSETLEYSVDSPPESFDIVVDGIGSPKLNLPGGDN